MAAQWRAASSCTREAVTEAADVLGFDIGSLMSDGPDEALDRTDNAQPALLVASVGILRAVSEEMPAPAYVAGHSMGEYSALVAAGALAYPDGLALVRARGRLMRNAGDAAPGGMAAVLGLDDEVVESVCEAVEGVQVANYNAPGQVVISGTRQAVAAASERLAAEGARRVVPLAVSIPAHSAVMAPVAAAFADEVAGTHLANATPPLVANITARPVHTPPDIREELAGGLTKAVRWTESIRFMVEQGVTEFIEVGPGVVLSGLVRRIVRSYDGKFRIRSVAEPPSG